MAYNKYFHINQNKLMDYEKIYYRLIMSRKFLKRNKKDGYFEKHHIVPKCMKGTDEKINTVLLTTKEHFIAHLLLTQCFEGELKGKMCFALLKMCIIGPKQKRIISSRQYKIARDLKLKFYKHSDETKRKISKKLKGRIVSEEEKKSRRLNQQKRKFENPAGWKQQYDKIKESNKNRTEEQKQTTSEKLRIGSTGKVFSKERRQNLSKANTGKRHSDETKKKLSEVGKGRTPWNKGKKGVQVAWNKGKPWSVEARKKMSGTRKGKKHSPERIEKIKNQKRVNGIFAK